MGQNTQPPTSSRWSDSHSVVQVFLTYSGPMKAHSLHQRSSGEKAWCEIVDSCAVVSQHRFQTHSTNNLPKANQPLCKDSPVANIIQQEGSLRTPPGFNKDSAFVSMLSTKAWVGRVTHIVFSFV